MVCFQSTTPFKSRRIWRKSGPKTTLPVGVQCCTHFLGKSMVYKEPWLLSGLSVGLFFMNLFLGFSANNLYIYLGDYTHKYEIADIPIITYLLIKVFAEFLPSVTRDPSVISDSVGFRETWECSLL